MTINVTLRYVFSVPIPDWYDFSGQLQAIALFWGIAVATYRGAPHLRRSALGTSAPPGGARLDVLATLITLLFLVPVAWMIWVKVGAPPAPRPRATCACR